MRFAQAPWVRQATRTVLVPPALKNSCGFLPRLTAVQHDCRTGAGFIPAGSSFCVSTVPKRVTPARKVNASLRARLSDICRTNTKAVVFTVSESGHTKMYVCALMKVGADVGWERCR